VKVHSSFVVVLQLSARQYPSEPIAAKALGRKMTTEAKTEDKFMVQRAAVTKL